MTLDSNKLDSIIEVLPKYEKMVDDAEALFAGMKGQTLESVCRTTPHYFSNYKQAAGDLYKLSEWLDNQRNKITAKVWKMYAEGYQKALGSKDIQIYVSGHKDVVEITEIILEVELIQKRMDAIVDSLGHTCFQLGNITKLRIAEMQDMLL